MRKFAIISIMLALASIAKAETLTLDSCIQMALRNNREIKAAHVRSLEQQQTEKSYFANYFPNIAANGLYFNAFKNDSHIDLNIGSLIPSGMTAYAQALTQGVIGAVAKVDPQLAQQLATLQLPTLNNVEVNYKLQNIYSVGVSLTQPIYMGGKITAAYKMNKLGTQMAQLNETLTSDQIVVQTSEAYSLLLKATEMHKVALQYDSLLAQLISDVESAERHGLRGHNEVLKVQVKKNEAELQVLQAKNAILLAQMNLCHYIGIALGSDIEIQEVNADQILPADASATVLARPEFNLLELKSQLAQQKIKLARSEFLPQLGVQFAATYLHGGELMGSTLLNSNTPVAYGVVNLTVPIWHGNEAQHKIKAAKYEYERTMLEQENLVEKMNLELQQAANVLNESIVELELARKSVEQAAENLRNSRRSFDVGLESLSELLEAQTLWQQAYAKKAIAESQLIVNEAKYRKACGQLHR